MHAVRIGRIVRTLRRRLGWRQVDLAGRAAVSQQAVSLVETGNGRRLSLATLERILGALEAEIELVVRWRGGELDRLTDEAHATIVSGFMRLLLARGWLVRVEVTYAIGRDRGSIDVLAFHPNLRALLVVEAKADLTSAESTLRRHDEKGRLAGQIARDRFGWDATTVSRLLVLPDASTPRRRVAGHGALFDHAYPVRGRAVARWLRHPIGAISGLLFLSVTNPVGGRRVLESRRRIGRPRDGVPTLDLPPERRERVPGFVDSSGEHQQNW
jgi:transcriptional regulator with XRE-family HTH domain